MIQPSSDSRRSIGQPIKIVTNNPTKKRKNVPSESDTETQITPIATKKKGKKAAKNPPPCSQSTLDPSSSQVIDLAQDSDDENAKVKHKRQRRNAEFDDIKIFFSEPYRRQGDVSEISLIISILHTTWGYILIYLWFGSLIISHQVPISVYGARKKSVYLEAAS